MLLNSLYKHLCRKSRERSSMVRKTEIQGFFVIVSVLHLIWICSIAVI